jgi:phosphate acetyltransferase
LNVAPNDKTRQAILVNLVAVCHAIGIDCPRIAILSATESPMESMPTSLDAADLRDWAATQGFEAKIDGPLAFDNAVSPEAVRIKGMTGRPVAGHADALVVPNIETGNALFKMMVYFRSACAAGVVVGGRVPIIITSRADPPVARLASAALALLSIKLQA